MHAQKQKKHKKNTQKNITKKFKQKIIIIINFLIFFFKRHKRHLIPCSAHTLNCIVVLFL